MQADLDIVVTPHHRARVSVKRILRADEIATALRDVLACMNLEREPVVIADWGDMFIESSRPIHGNIDVFPLGTMAYRMLTGADPPAQLLFVPGAPPLLARLIVRMVSANPGQRPNILEVKAVISSMLGTHDEAAPLVLPPDDPPEELLDLAPPLPSRTRTAPARPAADEELLDLGLPPDEDVLTLE